MTEHISPTTSDDAPTTGSPRHDFESPEGLRALLIRLHESGPGAWQPDREAAELMRYTAIRYRPLAQKHDLDPWEIASAASEVMLAASTRKARNPWSALLRIVLGHPDRKYAGTPTGDGILLRLLDGEPLDSLRCDTGLLAAIWAAKPSKHDAT